ncbi:hypothetical protein [Oryzomicrobium sp.]|uniref:hypothetical protein n=1 Tax=Oryzomicrobium sp. TaxID=1911578 RepID=UPI002FE15EA7
MPPPFYAPPSKGSQVGDLLTQVGCVKACPLGMIVKVVGYALKFGDFVLQLDDALQPP